MAANIEIVEQAGIENNYIFGATVEQLAALREYDPVPDFTGERPN